MPLRDRQPEVFSSLAAYQYLDVIETEGSIAAGALKAKASQPAVSAAIGRLETALDLTLVDRTSGRAGATLTEAGYEVLWWWRQFLEDARSFDVGVRAIGRAGDGHRTARRKASSASSAKKEPEGYSARIAASTTTSEILAPRWIRLLERKHQQEFNEKLKVSLLSTRSRSVLAAVRDELCDVGFVATTAREVQQSELEYEKVGSDKIIVVVPRGHRWELRRKKVSVPELLEEPQVAREEGAGALEVFKQRLNDYADGAGENLQFQFRTNSSVALLSAAATWQRPAIMSSLAVEDELALDEFYQVEISGLDNIVRDRNAVWRPGEKEKSPWVNKLISIASASNNGQRR